MDKIDWTKMTEQELEHMIALYRAEIAVVMQLPWSTFMRLPSVDKYLMACGNLRDARAELAKRIAAREG